jgi:hypothetical protein
VTHLIRCPRCGQAQHAAVPECERCGVIFARLRAPAESVRAPAPESPGIDRAGWIACAVGAGLALLTQALPLLEVLVGYFVVLVHELGHALAGWIFGRPSLPAFDFTQGGGVTIQAQRSAALLALAYALLAGAARVFRHNRASLRAVAAVAAAYTALLASGLDRAVILAMGHGGELLFAGVFLHRALSGRALAHPAERPLYAWLGFHVVFHGVGFAFGLMTSSAARSAYAAAKGGGHWMDFSQLSRLLHLPLEALAAGFLLACVALPAAVLLAHLNRARVAAWLERLARVEPSLG